MGHEGIADVSAGAGFIVDDELVGPEILASCSATTRALTSVGPPAASGTTM